MILLVENNERDKDWTTHLLQKNRITNEVKVYSDGSSALHFLLDSKNDPNRALPDIIIVACGVPDLDIPGFLKSMRTMPETEEIPVVVLCSSADELDRIGRLDLGRVFTIHKPLGFYKLVEALHKLGMFWTLSRVPPGVAK